MALVVDAVHHFFPSTHTPVDNQNSPRRSQTPANQSVENTPQGERLRETSQQRVAMSASPGGDTSSRSRPQTPAGQSGRIQEQGEISRRQDGQIASAHNDQAGSSASGAGASVAALGPEEDDGATNTTRDSSSSSLNDAAGSDSSSPRRIKVRDLAHIQSIAGSNVDMDPRERQQRRTTPDDTSPQYEISGMPIEHIIEMVAGLLTKITTTNDVQHEHLHRGMPHPENTPSISPQTTSVLAFHGKNVPSITILSYLNRINKYCPTSYEVFISLLVYFDRMTEKVNAGPIQSLREATQQASTTLAHERELCSGPSTTMDGIKDETPTQTATPPHSAELAQQRHPGAVPGTPHSRPHGLESPVMSSQSGAEQDLNLAHFFVVDSFNIHRLVIAGVTCASKFFSDIFYTNSRYAKVSQALMLF